MRGMFRAERAPRLAEPFTRTAGGSEPGSAHSQSIPHCNSPGHDSSGPCTDASYRALDSTRLEGFMSFSRLSRVALVLLSLAVASAAQAQTSPTSIQVTWTAPGDDGTVGTATQYDLRYSTSAITAANFAAATRWSATPT